MSNEKERKQESLGAVSQMRRKASRICRDFTTRLQRDTAEFAVVHRWELIACVRNAKKSLRGSVKLPLLGDGTPYIFRFSQMLLSSSNEALTEKSIGEALQGVKEKHRFYDEELLRLPSFLSLAAGELYIREGKIFALETVILLARLDVSSLFFTFSEVEELFLQERAGVYRVSDASTRRLYHMRLERLSQKEGRDALALAQEIVSAVNERQSHLGALLPAAKSVMSRLYFPLLLALCFMLLLLFALGNGAGLWNILLLPFVCFPLYRLAKALLKPFASAFGERSLPRISEGEELSKTKALVCIESVLFGEEADGRLFDRLEDAFLLSHERGDGITFAVIGDLPKSEKRTMDKDASVLSYAEKRISALCAKYGEHFALFVRGRRRSEGENAYIGWEGKHGRILEICRFLRGKGTGFLVEKYERERLSDVKYLIILDADTSVYAGAVRDLVGTMLHPENRPIVDPDTHTVVKGHGMLQPRMTTTLFSSTETLFADIMSGFDRYDLADDEVYQGLFDEGSCLGKGILDVDAFLTVCEGFFPKERLLCHDLVEGCLLRAGFVGDIVWTDGAPKNAIAYDIRSHRRIQGDLQILPYALNIVQNENGEAIRNPISPLSRYKIWERFLRTMTPLFSMAALLLGGLIGGRVMLWTLLAAFSPVLLSFAGGVLFAVWRHGVGVLWRALAAAFFQIGTIAYDAFVAGDVVARALYRSLISRKSLLHGTSEREAKKGYFDDYILRFSPSMMLGLLFFGIPGVITKLLGALWLAMPFVFWILSHRHTTPPTLCARDRERLLRYTHDAWLFYRDHVTAQTHGLPPDHAQFSPVYSISKRTSPTDIGLYLTSLLCARDLRYIESAELYERSRMTAQTIKSLFKWNGHLYHLYATDTLCVAEPFVSTVDSGNFIASLVVFCEGAKKYASEEAGFLDVIGALEEVISETDFSALYDASRSLFYIGYHVQNGAYTRSYHDTFMSAARLASYYAVATRAVPRSHYFIPLRRMIAGMGSVGIASQSGTAVEFFMPSLFLPTARRSMTSFALSHAYRMQRKYAVSKTMLGKKHCVFGVSESGYFAFDGEMHYQTHVFGTASLALDPMVSAEKVISPYSSFLMLCAQPERVMENLATLETLGMYGKYGFYEALDLEPSRVGEGYARIQRFTACHIGMSVVSAGNLLQNGIFQRRFLKNPFMRASAELLSEKMPTTFLPYRGVKRIRKETTSPRYEPIAKAHEPQYAYTQLHPDVAMVTNHKTKILASSSGHIAIESGSDLLSHSDFDLYTLGNGFRVYVNIDGTVFPTVPLMQEADGFSSDFSFVSRAEDIVFSSHHTNGKHRYEITLRLSVFPDRECCEVVCDIRGIVSFAYATLYFEPVMMKKREYSQYPFSENALTSEYHADEGVLLFSHSSADDRQNEEFLGIKVFPTPKSSFFDTMRDRVLRPYAMERDHRMLAGGRDFSDSKGKLRFPACAMKSETVGAMKGKIVFLMGMASDADDLLYMLSGEKRESRAMRRMKMGELLNLQYRMAGLSRSVMPLEHFVLRSMIFGQIRPHTENYKTITESAQRRFSISGENPIVLVHGYTGQRETVLRLREVIGLFKYMCIRGVRYDLVLCYREAQNTQTERERLAHELRRCGCERFLSFSCGIFPIDENTLTQEERFSYEISADVVFDLSYPMGEASYENARAVPLSREVEGLLKKEIETKVLPLAKPQIDDGARGVLLQKPRGHVPFSHILASPNFGTILTENSLGFTYARNAFLGRLTPYMANGTKAESGERILLRIYERFDGRKYRDFDLCAISAWVNYRFDGVEYYGQVDGIRVVVRVSLLGLHDAKRLEITLESEKKARVAVIFSVMPAPLGDMTNKKRFYRFRKESLGLRIFHLCDESAPIKMMAVFSPDATATCMEMAALRSDGAVFRGEEDAAILLSRMTLCGKRTVRFYLSAVFSEKQRHAVIDFSQNPSLQTSHEALENKTEGFLDHAVLARLYTGSDFCRASGVYGFYDRLCDGLALLPAAPHLVKRILFCAAAHQYEEGDVQNIWHPRGEGLRFRGTDDLHLFVYAVADYVQRTGDFEIWNARIAYLSSPVLAEREDARLELPERTSYRETLREHIKRAIAYLEKQGEGEMFREGLTVDFLDENRHLSDGGEG